MAPTNIAKTEQADEILISSAETNLDKYLSQESSDTRLHRALEMTSVLQSTLELATLIELFVREAQKSTGISGADYQYDDYDVSLQTGQQGQYRYQYKLLVGSQALGELTLYHDTEPAESETAALEYLLSSLLYPLRNAVLYLGALRTALKDPLTGVNNRCAFDKALKREMDLARRYGTPFCILIADIDHFKKINDSFGHLYGDCVLREVAQRIENCIRSTDILFRYGGEEFAILLSNTPVSGAQLTAERIRREVSKLGNQEKINDTVTVSIGGSELQSTDTPQTIFSRADKALYEAKNEGRNRVYINSGEA